MIILIDADDTLFAFENFPIKLFWKRSCISLPILYLSLLLHDIINKL